MSRAMFAAGVFVALATSYAFVIDGRASDGETWIYRELYWEVTPCRCQDEQ